MGAVQTAFDFGPVPRPSVAPRHAPPPASTAPLPVAPGTTGEQRRRAFEAELSHRLRVPVTLTVTDNGRTMLSSRDAGDHLRVRMHHMFLDAEAEVVDAMSGYLRGADDASQRVLRRFVKQESARIRKRPRRTPRLAARGQHHDLSTIYDDVNRRYFDGQLVAHIGWSRRNRTRAGARRRSIKLGSYRARDALIRVHPVLDASWVPRYFVEYIVYHEMLHHVVPMPTRGGRRSLHGPEFTQREQRFEHYQRAIAWERQHLDRLLGG